MQRARGFASAHQHQVLSAQVVFEGQQRLVQRLAGTHALLDLADEGLQALVVGGFLEHGQRTVQRHVGLLEVCHFACEQQHILALEPQTTRTARGRRVRTRVAADAHGRDPLPHEAQACGVGIGRTHAALAGFAFGGHSGVLEFSHVGERPAVLLLPWSGPERPWWRHRATSSLRRRRLRHRAGWSRFRAPRA